MEEPLDILVLSLAMKFPNGKTLDVSVQLDDRYLTTEGIDIYHHDIEDKLHQRWALEMLMPMSQRLLNIYLDKKEKYITGDIYEES